MSIAETDVSVEVVEIYPNLEFRLPSKLKEQGTCHVILKIGELSMEIKNIRYQIRTNGGVWVGPPVNIYPDHEANQKSSLIKRKEGKVARPIYTTVPTITFEDQKIFDKVKEVVEKELQEDTVDLKTARRAKKTLQKEKPISWKEAKKDLGL